MIRDTLEAIQSGIDVRKNLSDLRQEIKAGNNRTILLYNIGTDYDFLRELLLSDDAKTRKNAALLIGDLEIKELMEPLMQAYRTETKRFVKSSYLVALKSLPSRIYLEEFKQRLNELSSMEVSVEELKHVSMEKRELSDLIIHYDGVKFHKFTGYRENHDIVLLTNRNFIHTTLDQIEDMEAKGFNAGVIVHCDDLKEVLKVRTFQELLFMIPNMHQCSMDPIKAAETVVKAGIVEYLQKQHQGKAPFYFRLEIKSKQELDKKSAFAKKMASHMETLTNRELINSTSNYEIELRLIENKAGNFNILLKLYTIPDDRFAYREESVPQSVKPVNAALTVELAKEYLKEDGQVLDPFCGVGTMLIERHKRVKANTMYGIDLSNDAIDKAKNNTSNAHQIIHYVNKNYFDFTHEYLFDEIITNMPMVSNRKTEDDIYQIYERFFRKSRDILSETGTMILYSHNKEFVRKLARTYNITIVKEFEISMKEGTYVFVLKYR